jgi:hypothetical protein
VRRENPCHYRYAGCAGAVDKGARTCDNCRAEHNRRETARRAARRKAKQCVKCGAPVARIKKMLAGYSKHRVVKEAASCCAACLAYFAERAAE